MFTRDRNLRRELDDFKSDIKELQLKIDGEINRQLNIVEKEVLTIKTYAKLLFGLYTTLIVPILIIVAQNIYGAQ